MEKKYIIQKALGSPILALNSYGSYSFICVSDIYHSDSGIKFFNTKEEAENYILQHDIKPATIVEVFM